MLQLQVLRLNPQSAKDRLSIKNFKEINLVDEIISLDDERKKLQLESDTVLSKLNKASKEIGGLMAGGQKEDAESKKQEVALLKSSLQPISDKLALTEKLVNEKLVLLPNLPSEKVPAGHTPADNMIVKEGGQKPVLPAGSIPHWDLAKKYNLIDFELGNKITGSGFPLYKNKGARLQRALIHYFLEFNSKGGYTEYSPPLLVNEASAFGTGQLPDKEGQMYFIADDNFFLIPTAEVPVTNIYRDEIIKETDLPVKMTAYT
ncbi:MAG: serine--tRNA ligase, partial [Chitinophagaceae bacterium]